MNEHDEIRKMLDEAFGDVMSTQLEAYAAQLKTVYDAFIASGFSETGALGFAQIMFADDLKRVRDAFQSKGGGSYGTGFGGL